MTYETLVPYMIAAVVLFFAANVEIGRRIANGSLDDETGVMLHVLTFLVVVPPLVLLWFAATWIGHQLGKQRAAG